MRAYTSKTKDGFVTALENIIAYFEDFGHKVLRTNHEVGTSEAIT
jgi:hypothetical protein